ncbi:MAG: peptidase and in kexin sedolisin [Actinomycetia bacterium]|nr:peptidase and in kexin sedolisin [Actinomycetes bacterium]
MSCSLRHVVAAIAVTASSVVIVVGAASASPQPATTALWKQSSSAFTSEGRAQHAMTYDAGRQRIVLFGGLRSLSANPATLDDTWEWDGTAWAQQTPAHSPPGRAGAVLVYDNATQRSYLFGGYSIPGGTVFDDVWAWDGTDWTDVTSTPRPSARSGASATYDAARGVVVLFGGSCSTSTSCADTWEFDGTTWTQRSPAHAPAAREGAAMAYDPAAGTTVLFGGGDSNLGVSGTVYGDTWQWDGTDWSQGAPTTPPSARAYAAMSYDPTKEQVVLFGGVDHLHGIDMGRALSDTLTFDGSNWTNLVNDNNPTPRAFSAMAFDAASQSTVLFGGAAYLASSERDNDTWKLTLLSGPPPACPGGVRMIPDPVDASKTALEVCGTDDGDRILLSPLPKGFINVYDNRPEPSLAPTGHVIVDARAGDDSLTVTGKLAVPVVAFGGPGNDSMSGGNEPDVIVGGDGDDLLTGGLSGSSLNDVLIGGNGTDTLQGGRYQDVLIAGTTVHDTDVAALINIQQTWADMQVPYKSRVSTLRAGPLASGNVSNDAFSDDLTGGLGRDWFLAHTSGAPPFDVIHDRHSDETTSSL